MTEAVQWIPLAALRARFDANVAAMAGLRPAVAAELRALPPTAYALATVGGDVRLGLTNPANGLVTPLPSLAPAAVAERTARSLYPAGYDRPCLVVGEDVGWLMHHLYAMPTAAAGVPGYRPPLYLVVADLPRLAAILHVQDWRGMLADPRARLFAGPAAADEFVRSLHADPLCPWPERRVTVDPAGWGSPTSVEDALRQAFADRQAEYDRQAASATIAVEGAADRAAGDRPLRVLGITSRYTTVLQHSMRDWLAAFDRLGHATRLMIEGADHELPNTLTIAAGVAAFGPDLVVILDHDRGDTPGLPAGVPVVMWVQDRLPHIYAADAGQRQGRLDYAIGYGRVELTQRFGYPPARFMPTMMAVNDARFAPTPATAGEVARYGCDVSFVSNWTTPADAIVADAIKHASDAGRGRAIDAAYQRLRAVYDGGGWVTSADQVRRIIGGDGPDADAVAEFFAHQVNNALFRHQAVRWVAELGVDLHLYGAGWDRHPEFARYARGPADNQTQLPTIYRCSAINLQVTPLSSVHPRLLDGVAAGAFFLIRSTTADALEPLLGDLWRWCQARGVRDGAGMVARRDAALTAICDRYAALDGANPIDRPDYFVAAAEEVGLSGSDRTPNTLWADECDRVTFASREQVQGQVRHFLARPDERRAIAAAMRERVLERHTYVALTRRLLRFLRADLRPAGAMRSAA